MHTFHVPLPVDLLRSLGPLVHSAHDPTIRLRPSEVLRATRTPAGPASVHVRQLGDGSFTAEAWGPGRAWCLDHVRASVGGEDRLEGFTPGDDRTVRRLHHRRPGLRIVATGSVWDVLVPTILAQRVTGLEAARAWTRLCRRYGEPAPGPHTGLRLPPSPRACATLDDVSWHRLGVERSRARAVRSASRHVAHLQAAVGLPPPQRLEHVTRVPGVGPWTAGLVLRTAAGDADAVEVGDYHVKDQVAYALAGEPRASDERMLELLAPFAGHRGRVVRLITSAGPRPPSFGPRTRVVAVEDL